MKFYNIFNFFTNKYKYHPKAVIVACYYNPTGSKYRLKAFKHFYDSIKHLEHRIVECVIKGSLPELELNSNIERIETESLLWHKESLLNYLIQKLPTKYDNVFWLDTDIIFTNKNWLIDSVKALKYDYIIQPFEYCIHLEKDELKPSFNVNSHREDVSNPHRRHPNMWKSFSANYIKSNYNYTHKNYDIHGHVGFAWGANLQKLKEILLYDKALIGGADHIMAHAAVGQINHDCIHKSFTDDIDTIIMWSKKFHNIFMGRLTYVSGDLYHIWHGDLKDRKYLKRIQDFTSKTKNIHLKDSNGLYISNDIETNTYIANYYKERELVSNDIMSNILHPLNPLNPIGIFNNQNIENSDTFNDKFQVELPEINQNQIDSTSIESNNFS
jgi:hypothetical protein